MKKLKAFVIKHKKAVVIMTIILILYVAIPVMAL